MDYGIRLTNASGYTQIDSDYLTYARIATGISASGYDMVFNDPLDRYILMVQPQGFARIYLQSSSTVFNPNGTTTYKVKVVTSDGTNYYWRLYKKSSLVGQSSDSHGIRVRNGNGLLLFDSGTPPLTIRSLIQAVPSGEFWWVITAPFASRPFIDCSALTFAGFRGDSESYLSDNAKSYQLGYMASITSDNRVLVETDDISIGPGLYSLENLFPVTTKQFLIGE